jgi:RNA polymerase sigma-70 factor (ECF subfamily)
MNGDPLSAADRTTILRWNADRDPEAFASLVRRHDPALRRVAAAVLGSAVRRDPELLADSLQEGYRRMLGALRSYRGESEPFAFLAAVLRRACLDTLRRETRARGRAERAAAFGAGGGADRATEDPAGLAERSIQADRVLSALDRLKEPDRSLVYLRDAEGVAVADLAKSFRMPEGTVKSRLARARTRLRGILAEEGVEP